MDSSDTAYWSVENDSTNRSTVNKTVLSNNNNQVFPQAYTTNLQFPQAYTTNLQPVNTLQDHYVWYPDSGATHHVTNDVHNLIDPAIYQGPDQLHVGNGIGLVIHSTGSSSLISQSLPLKLVNILHVPDIQKNLLSVYRLTNDNSVFIEFHATYCVVKDEVTGKPLLRGTVKDGLYLLAQAQPPEVNIRERTGVDLWHHRLGHPNMRLLHSLISTYGLPMLSINKTLSCDACLTSNCSVFLTQSLLIRQLNHSKLSTQIYGDPHLLSRILVTGIMFSLSTILPGIHGYIH